MNDPVAEYSAANENLRYAGNLKLAEVTVFVAATGGLIAALFNIDAAKHAQAGAVLKTFGLIVSWCFLVILESTQYAWFHFAERAARLEKELNYSLWSSLPGAPGFKYRPAAWAMRGFYLIAIVFWIVALIAGDRI